MKFLQCLLPSPELLSLKSYDLDLENQCLTLGVSSTQTVGRCPLCSGYSQSVHSHYQRTLRDLPCLFLSLTIILEVSKFFSRNKACQRRIFTERLPEVAAPWARKTVRQLKHLQTISLALGGEAGSQLGKLLGYPSRAIASK